MEVLWIGIAFVLGLAVRHLGQPTLVGYLIAGIGLNAFGVEGGDTLRHIAHIGVMLLLFVVGLKLRLKSLIRPEVMAGSLLHMALSVVSLGAVLILVFGMSDAAGALVATALAFSSTVVAAKVLEGKKELRAFHGRVAIGILVMQDLVAVALLSSAGGTAPSPWALALLGLPLLRPLLFKLTDISGHDELLVLFGLLMALVVGGAGFEALGLSGELGALLMGAMLADHPRSAELSHGLWGLKEMLLIGFFLQIGMAGIPSLEQVGIALLLTALLPLKAALFFFLLLLFKLRARTAFLAGLSLATYSEFGLIVADMAVRGGWLDNGWMITIAMAVVFSFVVSGPFNRHAHRFYERFAEGLEGFERDQYHPDDEPVHLGNSHIVIMGMGRVGTAAYDLLTKRQQRVVGLDSDPAKVEQQRRQKRRVLFADAEDSGFWQKLELEGIHAILLAMPDLEANTIAARQLRKRGYRGLIIAATSYRDHIPILERAGANMAYDYFSGAGVGFAEHVWEALDTNGYIESDR